MVDVHTLKISPQPVKGGLCNEGLSTSSTLSVIEALQNAQCQLDAALDVLNDFVSNVPAEYSLRPYAAATCAAIAKAMIDSVVEVVEFAHKRADHA
ncbi:hypothetical protein F3J16_05260 [Burkholderia sp. Ap-962]|uniref:hypothetical protein n=1 Tax=Burkholderia sp. Ap-962 TaxID=2608333 RepID=UPI0014240394|nr:hypothetical protein [Burkholderia sp. Ap-962]NIF69603.1 hypothetical protein [Burkholderia sp. Ap-962]